VTVLADSGPPTQSGSPVIPFRWLPFRHFLWNVFRKVCEALVLEKLHLQVPLYALRMRLRIASHAPLGTLPDELPLYTR